MLHPCTSAALQSIPSSCTKTEAPSCRLKLFTFEPHMRKPTLSQKKLIENSGNLRYHDLLLSARRDVSVIVFVLLVLVLLSVLLLLVLLRTGLQLCLLLVHRGAVEATLFTDAAVGQAVVVLTHGRYWPRELCW